MKLTLKKQFTGAKITRQHKIGQLSFDSSINNEGEYEWYYNNGFADIFEVSEIIETNETEQTKQPKSKKYKGVENGKK
jgi:hypothetical protein